MIITSNHSRYLKPIPLRPIRVKELCVERLLLHLSTVGFGSFSACHDRLESTEAV